MGRVGASSARGRGQSAAISMPLPRMASTVRSRTVWRADRSGVWLATALVSSVLRAAEVSFITGPHAQSVLLRALRKTSKITWLPK